MSLYLHAMYVSPKRRMYICVGNQIRNCHHLVMKHDISSKVV